ncbi:MAG: hypothetical protein H0T62_14460 [Parachlamydiaceae bacterium]|nr:hypothetical protein [Parachlamydiaceae bacterium]
MKKLYVILLPICCSFFVGEQSSQEYKKDGNLLVELEKESLYLQAYKTALQAKIDIEHHREMEQEMEGQRSMVEHQWHDVSEEMKAANVAEKKAHRFEAELGCLNKRLTKILTEKEELHSKPQG